MSIPIALRERLAALEHDRWARWMTYLFSQGTQHADGTWTMPAWAVDRWRRQATAPYAALSEAEKDSDRAEVLKTWEALGDLIAALEAARHELTTLDGLWAHDGYPVDAPTQWQIDVAAVLRQLDAVLPPPEVPT